ncbi:MAG TPA: anti-sigma factor [Catenuloplanes sp.]|jgi:anti-sigma-K factor RskA
MSTDIHALAGAYVLDAVSDIERAAFTRHLAECPSCAAEVDELREAAARLADSTWSVPSPRLRTRVLEEVGRTRQLPPGGALPERDATAAVSRWRRVTAVAAAACILATGAGAATYALQEQRLNDQRALAAALRAENERVKAVLAAPDVRVKTTELLGGGQLILYVSPSHDAGVAVLAGAVSPGANRAYQLWMMDAANHAFDRGVLPAGTARATRLVTGVRGMESFGVTVEPPTGSPTPNLNTATTILLA